MVSHQFPMLGLPLASNLWVRRGNFWHEVLTASQADGSDVSWFGYTAVLVVPAGVPAGTVVLNPALVDTPGAGEIDVEINTQGVGADARGPWSLTVVEGAREITLWQGRLVMEAKVATLLRMEDGCGLQISHPSCLP